MLFRPVIISLFAGLCTSAFAVEAGVEQSRFLEIPKFISGSGIVAQAKDESSSLVIFRAGEETSPKGVVTAVIPASSTDLVILDAGYKQNIRPGMVCLVEQEGKAIASLSIAESTLDHAVGLILTLAPGATIKAGDTAKIKTVHFN